MVKKKNIYIIFAIILITIILAIRICLTYMIVMPINITSKERFGIIDGHISEEHNNIIKMHLSDNNFSSKQHGDKILDYLACLVPNESFYYFDAEENHKISTTKLMEGLQWMLDLKVNRVAISLSSKYYSKDLEKWIKDHSKQIKIYASYNNVVNTYDYPAGYEEVIGVGTSGVLNCKKNDIIYTKSRILLILPQIHIYRGNSYLTPYAMIINKGSDFV